MPRGNFQHRGKEERDRFYESPHLKSGQEIRQEIEFALGLSLILHVLLDHPAAEVVGAVENARAGLVGVFQGLRKGGGMGGWR